MYPRSAVSYYNSNDSERYYLDFQMYPWYKEIRITQPYDRTTMKVIRSTSEVQGGLYYLYILHGNYKDSQMYFRGKKTNIFRPIAISSYNSFKCTPEPDICKKIQNLLAV